VSPSYPYPQLFSNMLINKNILLIMKSRNSLAVYRIGELDIMLISENFTSASNIFYILRSENYMYYVTVNGELFRIFFKNDGTVGEERLNNYYVGDYDRVYIASRVNGTDDIYILSSDGRINRNAADGSISINSRNKQEDIFVINIDTKSENKTMTVGVR
jgi:hypothetical protein